MLIRYEVLDISNLESFHDLIQDQLYSKTIIVDEEKNVFAITSISSPLHITTSCSIGNISSVSYTLERLKEVVAAGFCTVFVMTEIAESSSKESIIKNFIPDPYKDNEDVIYDICAMPEELRKLWEGEALKQTLCASIAHPKFCSLSRFNPGTMSQHALRQLSVNCHRFNKRPEDFKFEHELLHTQSIIVDIVSGEHTEAEYNKWILAFEETNKIQSKFGKRIINFEGYVAFRKGEMGINFRTIDDLLVSSVV